jgi:zinc and cadmium transporter
MMQILVLFFVPLLSGLLIYALPKGKRRNFGLLLVYAGSYLFAITVTHILPELYWHGEDINHIGIFVLAGFFLQQVLEYFTSGIEHGHLHKRHEASSGEDHHQTHRHKHHLGRMSAAFLVVALCLHAFLEGAVLVQPPGSVPVYDVNAVLMGILLHRAPAAFALMTVLSYQLQSDRRAFFYLLLFSLAAPLGLLLGRYLAGNQLIDTTELIYLYALVCGNFLHISTTIVFESSPEHRFSTRKLVVALLGALTAVAAEHFI